MREIRPAALLRPVAVLGAAILLTGSVLALVSGAVGTRGAAGFGWRAVMNVFWADRDLGLWAWFSVAEIALLALAFGVSAVVRRAAGLRFGADVLFAVVAAYLSADESAALHERLGSVAKRLGVHGTYDWVALGLPVAAVGAVVLWFVARRIDARTRRRLVLAAVVYLGGALVLETLGGTMVETWHLPYYTFPYVAEVTVEEAMEAAGVLIALWAVLDRLRITAGPAGLGIVAREVRAAQPVRERIEEGSRVPVGAR